MGGKNNALIDALCSFPPWPHSNKNQKLVETHISWVLLAGDNAYKIKKPVNFGFLDFTTLKKRKFFCEEEYRLNKRLAPKLYLGVIPIFWDENNPTLSGKGAPIEYAVKMRRFPDGALLLKFIDEGAVSEKLIIDLAEILADFHLSSPPIKPDSSFDVVNSIWAPVDQNFKQIIGRISDSKIIMRSEVLRISSRARFDELNKYFGARKINGFIRELHGDLHLGNIAVMDGRIMIFDALEFNENFRWIDITSEMASLIVDLEAHKRPDFSRLLLNKWLEKTGDYDGVRALQFFKSYRAMVRAKVILLGAQGAVETNKPLPDRFYKYLELAEKCVAPKDLKLSITCGVSGSGKTTYTNRLLKECDVIRIRSDVERMRLFPLKQDRYSRDATEQTYNHLLRLAGSVLSGGCSAVIDATFLKKAHRDLFVALAREKGADVTILSFDEHNQNVLTGRIGSRDDKISEANSDVIRNQLGAMEPLSPTEEEKAIHISGKDTPNSSEKSLQAI